MCQNKGGLIPKKNEDTSRERGLKRSVEKARAHKDTGRKCFDCISNQSMKNHQDKAESPKRFLSLIDDYEYIEQHPEPKKQE